MPYVIGIVLSVAVAVFARFVGFDRDRAFYPTVLIVIGSIYVLFAAMSGSVNTVLLESIPMVGFAIAAVAGFKSSAWIVVGGLAGHGVFDALHGRILENSGVPVWWPAFCLAYDLEPPEAWQRKGFRLRPRHRRSSRDLTLAWRHSHPFYATGSRRR